MNRSEYRNRCAVEWEMEGLGVFAGDLIQESDELTQMRQDELQAQENVGYCPYFGFVLSFP